MILSVLIDISSSGLEIGVLALCRNLAYGSQQNGYLSQNWKKLHKHNGNIYLILPLFFQMGLMYGYPVEDIITGLTIQCRGWKSVYYNPSKPAFLGVAPTILDVALVQHKRWAEGMFQIFLSKYCPFIYGHGKIKLGAQMGYCIYLLWPPVSVPTLTYVLVPSLSLLHGIPLFPKVISFYLLFLFPHSTIRQRLHYWITCWA